MTSRVMEKLTNKFKMDIESIACDMVDMGVYKIEDIKQYGFNDTEAQAIQKAINNI
mgnify:CR=1 FL=1